MCVFISRLHTHDGGAQQGPGAPPLSCADMSLSHDMSLSVLKCHCHCCHVALSEGISVLEMTCHCLSHCCVFVRRCDDPLVKQCVTSFTADWNVVERRYGAFHGQDQQTLQRRFASLRRTPSGVKILPTQDYEVDMQEDTTVSGRTHVHVR